MNAIMRSFVMGMLPGAVSRAQFPAAQSEQPEKEPIGFLYGYVAGEGETPTHTIDGVGYVGAVLPKLPEWDREAYPYAVVSDANAPSGYETYYLVFAVEAGTYTGKYNGARVGGGGISYSFQPNYSPEYAWKYKDSFDNGYAIGFPPDKKTYYSNILWTNHRVLNADGSIFCEKMEAYVPVYE